eukprot:6683626-Prymnesium_polylepis.1
MSDSVAARLGDESFWVALARLRDECGISDGELVSFMSGSVAVRLGDESFWVALARLRDECGTCARAHNMLET